ncbi:MAG: chemotaxis protein CheB [Armatimonadota bacterium]
MAFDLIVIGTSLGGLRALETIVDGLPDDFQVPLAIVQHRATNAGVLLRQLLQRRTRLRVVEPDDKDEIQPGRVYLAPPDYHLLVEPGSFALSTEGRVNHARPAIDVLFETASDAYGSRVLGVLLTGANEDGARGAARIKRRGGTLLVQDPADAECGVMPASALKLTQPDRVLALCEIAPALVQLCSAERNDNDAV